MITKIVDLVFCKIKLINSQQNFIKVENHKHCSLAFKLYTKEQLRKYFHSSQQFLASYHWKPSVSVCYYTINDRYLVNMIGQQIL